MLKKILLGSILCSLLLNLSACSPDNSENDTKKITTNNKEEESNDNPKLFNEKDCWSLSIDGVEYTFPMKYEDFVTNDWEVFNSTLDDTLYPKVTAPRFTATHNETGTSFDLVLANFSKEEIDYKEGYIVGMSIHFTVTQSTNDKFPKIILPGGFVFNEQPSLDKMESVYGTPSKEEYGDYIYIYDNNILTRCWEFSYDNDKLDGFSIVNYDNPEQSN